MRLIGSFFVSMLFLFSFSFDADAADAAQGNANVVRGVVVTHDPSCDYFVVYTGHGYALLKRFSGSDPLLGDQLVGDFGKHGVTKIYDLNRKSQLSSSVEDYVLNEHSVTEMYYQVCA